MSGPADIRAQLEASVFIPRLQGTDKQAVMEELIDALAAAGCVPSRDDALRVVMERERRMSTGLEWGVAMPHGKLDTIHHLATAFGLKPGGVEFDTLDGRPARIVIMMVSAVTRPQEHMQFLSGVGRALSCPSVREQVLAAGTHEDLIQAMVSL